jgi:hypothetical protein
LGSLEFHRAATGPVRVAHPAAEAVSIESVAVSMQKADGGVTLEMPLQWTDIVLLPRE